MPPPPEPPIPESFDDWLYDPPSLPPEMFLPAWAWWVIGVLSGILLVYLFFKLRRRLRIPALPGHPNEEALGTLSGLRARAETLHASELGVCLTAAINTYLHRRYGELASYHTRDELFATGSRPGGFPPMPTGVSGRFSQLMAKCEEMRFAGTKSPLAERRATVAAAVRAIEEEPA